MIVVIQCAGGKNPNAGRFKTEDGRPICSWPIRKKLREVKPDF